MGFSVRNPDQDVVLNGTTSINIGTNSVTVMDNRIFPSDIPQVTKADIADGFPFYGSISGGQLKIGQSGAATVKATYNYVVFRNKK